MTVSPNSPVSGPYLTDGVSNLWEFNFKINADDQIKLRVTNLDGSDGEDVDTGFTIDPIYIGQDNGGYILYPSSGGPIATGKRIIPFRAVEYSQPNRIGNQGGFFPETHERTFDLLAMQIQQLQEAISRALIVAIGDVAPEVSQLLVSIHQAKEAAEAAAAAAIVAQEAAEAAIANIPGSVIGVLSDLPDRPDGDISGLSIGQWYINGGTLSRVQP